MPIRRVPSARGKAGNGCKRLRRQGVANHNHLSLRQARLQQPIRRRARIAHYSITQPEICELRAELRRRQQVPESDDDCRSPPDSGQLRQPESMSDWYRNRTHAPPRRRFPQMTAQPPSASHRLQTVQAAAEPKFSKSPSPAKVPFFRTHPKCTGVHDPPEARAISTNCRSFRPSPAC